MPIRLVAKIANLLSRSSSSILVLVLVLVLVLFEDEDEQQNSVAMPFGNKPDRHGLKFGVWPRAAALPCADISAELRCACGWPNFKHQTPNTKLQNGPLP